MESEMRMHKRWENSPFDYSLLFFGAPMKAIKAATRIGVIEDKFGIPPSAFLQFFQGYKVRDAEPCFLR